MQPYLFPYIGYYQLINYVDKFIIYDDVQYIQGGWINRNKILMRNKEQLFTFSLKKDSFKKNINNRELSNRFNIEKTNFFQTLDACYRKAPYYKQTMSLLEEIFDDQGGNLSIFIIKQLKVICEYLNIKTPFVISSELGNPHHLHSEDRVIAICQTFQATEYINPIGGKELYYKEHFLGENIELKFLRSMPVPYQQFSDEFIPYLSIIDILMFNSERDITNLLKEFKLE